MELKLSLIAIIARLNPQIWEIVGGGPGGWGRLGSHVELNPQPLPPIAAGLRYGAAVGGELVRAAQTAELLGTGFEPGDDICPPPRRFPPIPFPFPPDPYPWRTVGEGDDGGYDLGYAAGLAFALEASSPAWSRLGGADALARVYDTALRTAEAGTARAE